MQSNLNLASHHKVTTAAFEPPQPPSYSQFSQKISPKLNPNQQQHDKQELMNKLVSEQPLKKIINFLKKNRGRNFPINYNPHYLFVQKWQSTHKQASSEILVEQLCGMSPWLHFIALPVLVVQIWLLSVFRVFQYENCQYIFIMGLIKQIVSILYSCIGLYITVDRKLGLASQLSKALSMRNIYVIIYYILLITDISDMRTNIYLLPLDITTIIFNYITVQKIYSKIRIKAIGSKYKHFMHLFDLGSNILILIHIFSVLMFLCTYYSPNDNWLSIAPFQIKSGWIFDYVYSFYFTCTTMLTVGYGDFRATNQIEILCILLVQLFGIVSNGYAISQIGANLMRLRSSRQSLQSDLSDAEKLAKFNAMQSQLHERMCAELVSNQLVNQQLSLKQQQNIMAKLNDQLKQEICMTNHINIVKTSLFMLANFSKRMQIELSKRMVKAIYPPNTTLLQILGKEKLFILAKGTLQIVSQKKWKTRTFTERVLRVIEKHRNNTNQVYRNAYGYSAMLSGRQSRLKAISKSFAVCYTLQQHDILDFIVGSHDDFERYHAMKIKYHMAQLPQKLQVPGILSSRQHYNPNIFLLIYHYLKSLDKVSQRKPKYSRSDLRCRLVLASLQQELREKSNTYIQESQTVEITDHQITASPELLLQLSKRIDRSNQNNDTNFINRPRIYGNRDRNNFKYQELRNLKLSEKSIAFMKEQKFAESYRQYKKYLPNGNITAILSKFQKGKQSVANLNEKPSSLLRTLIRNKKILKSSSFRVND